VQIDYHCGDEMGFESFNYIAIKMIVCWSIKILSLIPRYLTWTTSRFVRPAPVSDSISVTNLFIKRIPSDILAAHQPIQQIYHQHTQPKARWATITRKALIITLSLICLSRIIPSLYASTPEPLLIFEPEAIEIPLHFGDNRFFRFSALFTYNSLTNTLFFRFSREDSTMQEINLTTRKTRERMLPTLPENITRMQVHPRNNDIYFWDEAVGRVYRSSEDGSLERIDNSFEHRNQFNHTGWMDHQGRIYAFGGYGLFTQKSFVTRFSELTGEWFMLRVEDESEMPKPQEYARVVPDLVRQQVYILGEDALHNDVPRYGPRESVTSDLGMWRFDYVAGRWHYLSNFPWRLNYSFRMLNSMHPGGDFMLMPVWVSDTRRDIVAWFPETGAYKFLSELGVRVTEGDPLQSIFWSEADQAYYLFYYSFAFNTLNIKLFFHRITIPDPDAFTRAYGTVPLEAGSAGQGSTYARFVMLGLVIITLVIWFMRGKKSPLESLGDSSAEKNGADDVASGVAPGTHSEDHIPPLVSNETMLADDEDFPATEDPDSLFAEADSIISQKHTGEPLVSIRKETKDNICVLISSRGVRTEVLNPLENRILNLMIDDFLSDPNCYTETDDMDEFLIPNHPSPDYIRRVRNITLERIAELLGLAAGKSTPDRFILRRKSANDKRKFEYRLNARLIRIEPGE